MSLRSQVPSSTTSSVSQAILSFPDLLEMPDLNRFTSSPRYSELADITTTSSRYSTDILSTTKFYKPAAPRWPLQEVWMVSPLYCPRCSKIPLPWSRKLRLHKGCNSRAEATTILPWNSSTLASTSPGVQVESTKGDVEGKEEILMEIIFTNGVIDCSQDLGDKSTTNPDSLEEVKSVRCARRSGLEEVKSARCVRRRKRKFCRSTEHSVVEVVHVEEDDINQGMFLEPSVNASSIDNGKTPDSLGTIKKMVNIPSDTVHPEQEIIKPPQDSLREMLLRNEYKKADIHQELRKILQRKKKTEEKERDCEEEMAKVRRTIKRLEREMTKMKKYNFM